MMKQKDIVCFICALSSGGAEHQMSELSNLLVKEGYHVRLVTFGDMHDHYQLDGHIERVRLAEGKGRIAKFISIFLFFLFCKTDCIISYGQRENVFCILPSLFRIKRNRIIACERSCTINRSAGTHEKILLNFLYKHVYAIVCNSYTQRDYILRVRPCFNGKVFTIINYLDLKAFTPVPILSSESVKIGIFARYDKLKNYERLVKVVASLKKKGYNFCVEWYGNSHILGGKVNPFFSHFEELINTNSLHNYIILHDHIKSVSKEILKFDALCIASLWEGFSNSIAEGISSGRPMIVSNVSDNSIMVHDGENGYLFDPLSVEDMESAFEKFLRLSSEERVNMGLKSRKIAESLFSEEIFVSSYKKIIEA